MKREGDDTKAMGRLRAAAGAALFAGLVLGFILALLPTDWDETGNFSGGPVIHLAGFTLATLYAAALLGGGAGRLAAVAAGLFLYGGAVEAAQTLVVWRSGEWADLIYNSVGIALGAALYPVVSPRLAVIRARLGRRANPT